MRYFLLAIFTLPAFGAPLIYLDGTIWTATAAQRDETTRIVKDAFSQFNVEVTTEDPGIRTDVAWVRIGGQFVTDPTGEFANFAGQSPVGVWHYGTTFRPFGTLFSASVYADGMNNDPTLTAHTIIHEEGHNFGLNHEDTGYMAPVYLSDLTPDNYRWTPADVAFFKHEIGVRGDEEITPDTAEPGVLLLTLGLVYLFSRRHHRQSHERPASSGTSRMSNTVESPACRAAASRSFASKCISTLSNPSHPSRSPAIRNLGMGGIVNA